MYRTVPQGASWFRGSLFFSWLVMAIGIALSMTAFWFMQEREKLRHQREFENRSHDRINAFRLNLEHSQTILSVIAAFVGSGPEAWHKDLQALLSGESFRWPGLVRIQWICCKPDGRCIPSSVPDCLSTLSQLRSTTERTPFSSEAFLQAVGRSCAKGRLILTPPIRASAARRLVPSGVEGRAASAGSGQAASAGSGQAASTGSGQAATVVLCMPVYHGGQVPEAPADRRIQLEGVLGGVLDLGELAASDDPRFAFSQMRIRVHDPSAPPDQNLLFDSGGEKTSGSDTKDMKNLCRFGENFPVADREWRMECYSDYDPMAAGHGGLPWGVGLGGLFLTGALVAYLLWKENARQTLLRYQQQLKLMASRLFFAEEQERCRLAEHLHDGVGALLSLAILKLDLLREGALAPAVPPLSEIRDLMDKAVLQTRDLTVELSSPVLHELGFEAAMTWLGEEMHRAAGLSVTIEKSGKEERLDQDAAALLFRAVRELLNNVVKHARTDRASIQLGWQDQSVQVVVEDRGVGSDAAQMAGKMPSSGGFGLFSIRERVEYFGGTVVVESKPGHGTRVALMLPLAAPDWSI